MRIGLSPEILRLQLNRCAVRCSVSCCVPSPVIAGEHIWRRNLLCGDHPLECGKPVQIVGLTCVRISSSLRPTDLARQSGGPLGPRKETFVIKGEHSGRRPYARSGHSGPVVFAQQTFRTSLLHCLCSTLQPRPARRPEKGRAPSSLGASPHDLQPMQPTHYISGNGAIGMCGEAAHAGVHFEPGGLDPRS